MKSVAVSLVACFLMSCCACKPAEAPQPGDPTESPPGLEEVVYGRLDSVGQACAWLEHFKCPEAKPEGTTCVESVRALTSLGTFEPKNLVCIRKARNLTALRLCSVECKP